MKAIYKKELKSYFRSPIGYVFVGIFMLVLGIVFVIANITQKSANFAATLTTMSMFFVFLVPLLTMRSFAEERKSKSDQLLLTAPVKITAIVMGKFLASLTVLLFTLLVSLLFPLILLIFGSPVIGEIFTVYFGFLLMGAASMAIGILISALTESQVVAAVATFGVFFVLLMASNALSFLGGGIIPTALSALSLFTRLTEFSSGVLGLSPIIYYLSITALCIFLTVCTVERRRWSGN